MILGGTGAIGGATAERLADRGWNVDVTARDSAGMPEELSSRGVRFHAVERGDTAAVERLVGDGVDLLVDLIAYSAPDVTELLPVMRGVESVVVVSSRAVYVDSQGRHINGDEPPEFPVPIPEDWPTLAPADPDSNPFTREGYAPGKVAVERASLDSGLPVTVIRPSKVHGRWARNARTRVIVERMLADAPTIELANRGDAIDHLTAAANTAALIEVVADRPGARILNIADPDPLTATQIVEAIARPIGWDGRIVGLEPDAPGGEHPWNAAHPIVLDLTAATDLGYRPVGTGSELIAEEATWVASTEPLVE
ncbi:hypothetical protein GCM10027568_16460 [Humibacter soli]